MSRVPLALIEKDAPAYVDLLPYVAVDPDCGAVLLADSALGAPEELGMVWRLTPVECETRSNDELGAIAARVDNVLRSVPEGTSCQFIFRAGSNVRPNLAAWDRASTAQDPIVEMISGSRQTAIEALSLPTDGGIFTARSLRALFTIRRAGNWPSLRVGTAEAALGLLGGARTSERVQKCYAEDRKAMTELARTVESLFAQAGVRCERLGLDALAAEIYETLNPDSARYTSCPQAASGESLAERVAQSHVEVDFFRGLIAIGESSHAVVSVTQFPARTTSGMLARGAGAAVLAAAPECDLTLAFHVPKQDQLRARLDARRRLATNQVKDAHQVPILGPVAGELARVEEELGAGERLVSLRMYVVVRGRTPEVAAERARSVHAALGAAGFRAIVERELAGVLWFQSLPLAYRPDLDSSIRRARTVLSMNVAHLAPVYGSMAGVADGPQIVLTREGLPVTIAFFHEAESPHAVLTGQPGSGKSVYANDLIMQVLRTGGRVWVIDRGGSYRKLAEILGGSYVALDAERPIRINPCGRAPADGSCPPDVNAFLRDWTVQMAARRGDLPDRDEKLLSIAVRDAFAKNPGREIRLSDIRKALEGLAPEHPSALDLAVSISDYCGAGPYARFFDGPDAADFANPLVAIDLANAALEESVASVLLMAIMHRITAEAARWPTTRKYLVVDEAWTLLQSPATVRFLVNCARTARKQGLALVTVSQQVTDLATPAGRAILDQSPNRVFLRQEEDAIRRAAGELGLSPREVELYRSLTTVTGGYSEFLFRSHATSGVGRLVLDPLSYWISTSAPQDRAVYEKLLDKARSRGIEGREAIRFALIRAAVQYPHGAAREVSR